MNAHAPQALTLSREETLAVLVELRASALPGLEDEPSESLTLEQEALVIAVARRALLARGLAQVRGQDLLLHRALLQMVGACAFAQASLLIHTWPAGTNAPARFFGHVREADIVAHTQPDPVLHRFELLPSKPDLVRSGLDFCQFDAGEPPVSLDIIVSQASFIAVRERAASGDTSGAVAALIECGAGAAPAVALVEAWASGPHVSVAQIAGAPTRGTGRVLEFTLIQAGRAGWWAALTSPGAPGATVRVKSASRAEVEQTLISASAVGRDVEPPSQK